MGMPPGLTAAVGMDALSHNLEAFFAPGYHPLARGIAVEGARLVKDWLPVSLCANRTNLEARANMLAASEEPARPPSSAAWGPCTRSPIHSARSMAFTTAC